MVSLGITLIYPMAGTPEYGALGVLVQSQSFRRITKEQSSLVKG